MDLDAAIAAINTAADSAGRMPTLPALARIAHTTPAGLRDAFLERLGITPKAYADARRVQRFRDALAQGETVTAALYSSGYSSTSRVYERHGELLGMSPAAYRRGGAGETIRYTLADTSLGRAIVGATDTGVCFIAFGADDAELLRDLAHRFPAAEIVPSPVDDAVLVSAVIALVDAPASHPDIPLDVRGTAFQQQVWKALTTIEPGQTVTYAQLARQIGRPTAVRAVAQACGANPLAVVVPCHRVIGADGSLTGYRWGVDLKKALLERERS